MSARLPAGPLGVTPGAAGTGPQAPGLWSRLGDSSSALLSTSVAWVLTPQASGTPAFELTTFSWPVLPRGCGTQSQGG